MAQIVPYFFVFYNRIRVSVLTTTIFLLYNWYVRKSVFYKITIELGGLHND